MKARAKKGEYGTYASLAVLNAAVAAMLVVLVGAIAQQQQVLAMATYPVASSSPSISLPEPSPVAPVYPITGTARYVSVPSIGINAAVQTGSYDADTHSWSISSESAYYADTTVPVNNTNGSTLIYGHAEWPLFGRLPEATNNAEAYVDTAEGLRFTYVFESKKQIDPNDVSALNATGPPKLLLLTCSGVFDAYRTLVTFQLTGIIRNE
jgi:LPXTG-site transpeptidase (sortase) family protein